MPRDYTLTPIPYDEEDRGHDTLCWIFAGFVDRLGYGRLHRRDCPGMAHVAMYVRHRGPVPAGHELDHLCRQPSCIRPEHLEPVTHTENMRRATSTKLTEADVAEIRALRGVVPGVDLARRFGVTKDCISKVHRKDNWTDDDDYTPGPPLVARPNAVLTMERAREIRQLRGVLPQAEVAARFGVTVSTVSEVWHNKRWREDG